MLYIVLFFLLYPLLIKEINNGGLPIHDQNNGRFRRGGTTEVCLADKYDKRNRSVLFDRQFNRDKSKESG